VNFSGARHLINVHNTSRT